MDLKIKYLFLKYIGGECSSGELEEIRHILQNGLYQDEWNAAIAEDAAGVEEESSESALTPYDAGRIYMRIETQLQPDGEAAGGETRVGKIGHAWMKYAAAAIVIMCLSPVLYLYFSPALISYTSQYSNDVPPGRDQAFLTLYDGRKISLTDAKTGELFKQKGILVSKRADGRIVYATDATQPDAGTGKLNTISTPAGGQWQVNLSDGTRIWLNAATSLTYPQTFAGLKERRVILKGEAYFEVAGDRSHPFIVETEGQKISVLGTSFNVNSYADEPGISTTLLEGSVKVAPVNRNDQEVIIKPDQEAVLNGDLLEVKEVNADDAIAWKNGYFRFKSEPIESIMRELSRWYDIEVKYENNLSGKTFTGKISKFKNISQVLKMLDQTKDVHFKVKGRRVTVTD